MGIVPFPILKELLNLIDSLPKRSIFSTDPAEVVSECSEYIIPNLKKYSMKQTQLYYALMLFFLVLCSCEDDIPLFPEENEFMSLSTKSSITLDENILQIQATV